MHREKDEIEDMFGTALSDLEITPTEEMEARLMASIDFVQPKKRRGLFWLWMGGLMTAVICLFFFNIASDFNPTQRIHIGQDKLRTNKNQEVANTENRSIIQSHLLTTVDNLSSQHQPSTQTSIKSGDQLIKKENIILKNTEATERLDSNMNMDGVTKIPEDELNLGKIDETNPDQDDITTILSETVLTVVDTANAERIAQDSTHKAPLTEGSLLTENEDDDSGADDREHNNQNDDEELKNKLSLTSQLAFPQQKNTTIPKTDSSWTINRGLLSAATFNFTHVWGEHLTLSSGVRLERTQENWSSTFQYEGLITKDTIIDGEPSSYTYFGSINNFTDRTYTLTQLGIPLSAGYLMRFGKFDLELQAGGLFNANFIKERTTLFNNTTTNNIKRETVFSFAPQTKLNLDYMWGRTGMGITVNYQLQNLNRSSLLEQALNRNNIGFGLRFLYTF